jgi:hypothetical protein
MLKKNPSIIVHFADAGCLRVSCISSNQHLMFPEQHSTLNVFIMRYELNNFLLDVYMSFTLPTVMRCFSVTSYHLLNNNLQRD